MSDKNSSSAIHQDNFQEVLNKYLKYWYWIVAGIILSLIVAFLYLRYATPMYEVSSSLLIKAEDSKSSKSETTSYGDLELVKTSQSVDNKIQELKSITLLERVIKELSLETSYFVDGSFRETELYGKSLPIHVVINSLDPTAYEKEPTIKIRDKETFDLSDDGGLTTYKFGQKVHRSYGVFSVEPTSNFTVTPSPIKVKFKNLAILAQQCLNNLSIASASEKADVVTIKYNTSVPKKGVDILNKLIEVANKEDLEDKNKIAVNTIKFIDDRLKYLTSDLSEVEKGVEQLKQQNNLTDVASDAKAYLDQSGQYNQQLGNAEVQLSVLESIERYVKQPANKLGLVPSSLGIEDATLTSLIGKFNELQLEKQRLLRTAQSDNPVVINIDEQLAGIRRNIIESLNNIKRGLTITRNSYKSNSSEFESKIKSVPSVERELQQIQRQQSVKQGQYLYLLQKREETALALAATVSNFRVIDNVNFNPIPVSPKKQLVYLCAFILGIGFPVAGIYTKDLLNNRVQTIQDVSSISNLRILGELSHSDIKGNLVIKQDSRTTISELFRLIRTNLLFYTSNIDNKVILVTSSMSGEGKTFFSSNLGSTLALAGKKVVLIEFDLRNPKLLEGLGVKYTKGIVNYLTESGVSVNDLLRPSTEFNNLFMIGAGSVFSSPSELLLNDKIGELISALKKEFDYIILDTSPIGQVADAYSLVPYSDTSIFLVRYNYTLKTQLNILEDISERLKNPMLVLNDAEINNYKGYGYEYGYGNSNNSKRLKLIG
ncbi:GumC family protein [Rubrolithibacter danxiaensis]|uniref:GumC family protein n=1 Tax=Rubrolithibacter danxiaensis TaxID=3390805 RepID=UPI003BF8186E